MARRTSLSIRRIAVKIKNGIETRAAVEARGSSWLRANINAAQIKINDRIIVGVFPNTTGKVLSPDAASPFISGRVVSKATDEKQNIVFTPTQLEIDDMVNIQVAHGSFTAKVIEKKENNA